MRPHSRPPTTAACPAVTCTYRGGGDQHGGHRAGLTPECSPSPPRAHPASPGAPYVLLVGADPANLGFVDLQWTPPSRPTAGSPVSSYALEVSTDGGSSWAPVTLLPGDVTTYGHFCGLPAITCTYRVSAANAVGLSLPSPREQPVTTQACPRRPTLPPPRPPDPEPDQDGLIDVVVDRARPPTAAHPSPATSCSARRTGRDLAGRRRRRRRHHRCCGRVRHGDRRVHLPGRSRVNAVGPSAAVGPERTLSPGARPARTSSWS